MSRLTSSTKTSPPAPPVPGVEAPSPLTLDQVLDALYGPSPAGAWVRLVSSASGFLNERFFRWVEVTNTWRALGSYPAGREPEPASFATSEAPATAYLDLIRYAAPDAGGARAPITAIWVAIPVRCDARRPYEPAPQRAPFALERAREQLARVAVTPSILLDEGAWICGVWTLSAPCDEGQASRLLLQLRQRCGGDQRRADLQSSLVRLPDTKAVDVFPTQLVTATRGGGPVHLADLEAALGGPEQ